MDLQHEGSLRLVSEMMGCMVCDLVAPVNMNEPSKLTRHGRQHAHDRQHAGSVRDDRIASI